MLNNKQRTHHSSKTNWIKLDTTEAQERRKNIKARNQQLIKQLKSAISYFKEQQSVMKKEDNENVLPIMKNACSYVLQSENIKGLIENYLGISSCDHSIQTDVKKKIHRFSKCIVDEIRNLKQKLLGNESQLRYSPRVLRIALSL